MNKEEVLKEVLKRCKNEIVNDNIQIENLQDIIFNIVDQNYNDDIDELLYYISTSLKELGIKILEEKEYNDENIYDYLKTCNIVNQYLNEIGKIPLLTEKEEKELAMKVKKGDINAKKKLISAHCQSVRTKEYQKLKRKKVYELQSNESLMMKKSFILVLVIVLISMLSFK